MSQNFNPYEASPDLSQPENLQVDPYLASRGQTMLTQMTVVGILQIVQGALESFLAASLIAFAFLFPMFAAQATPATAPQMPPNVMFGLTMYYGIAGSLTLLFGILRIMTGIMSFWFRGRLLLFISLFGGLVSCSTFYCSITSIALAIYGAIVLTQPGIKYAFQLAKNRMPAKSIRTAFGQAFFGQRGAS
jgi:hypothetical protein